MCKRSILVTGASGFIGRALCAELVNAGHKVVGAVRSEPSERITGVNYITVGDINSETQWTSYLDDVDVIIHLAARVHQLNENTNDLIKKYRKVNVEGTLHLANSALNANVRRFIFLSSIKANGEKTVKGMHFSAQSTPEPCDPYGISKYEAEVSLKALTSDTNLDIVILRPPLVYGPKVGGNFIRLLGIISKGMPLPFGAVNNKRSMIFLYNLTDVIRVCIDHPKAAGKVLLVSDKEDLSTAELITKIASIMKKNILLLSIPIVFMHKLATLLGKKQEIERLCESLSLDIDETTQLLDWVPPISMDEGLTQTIAWYHDAFNTHKRQ